jgi:hypothetical protein
LHRTDDIARNGQTERFNMADDQSNPLLIRADAAIREAKRLQAEMDATITAAELHAERLEQTFLRVRTIVSRHIGQTSGVGP